MDDQTAAMVYRAMGKKMVSEISDRALSVMDRHIPVADNKRPELTVNEFTFGCMEGLAYNAATARLALYMTNDVVEITQLSEEEVEQGLQAYREKLVDAFRATFDKFATKGLALSPHVKDFLKAVKANGK